jgi:hypothetical protein
MIAMSTHRRTLILAGALLAALSGAPAFADVEPTRETPIARSPDLTLGALLPANLPETAFVSVTVRSNEAEGPFEASFEALLDGGMMLNVIVSDREASTGIVSRLFEPGPMRDALIDDEDFTTPEGATCLGSTAQAMITCSIGDGMLQVTGTSIGSDAFPYETVKDYATAIDLERVAEVLAQ